MRGQSAGSEEEETDGSSADQTPDEDSSSEESETSEEEMSQSSARKNLRDAAKCSVKATRIQQRTCHLAQGKDENSKKFASAEKQLRGLNDGLEKNGLLATDKAGKAVLHTAYVNEEPESAEASQQRRNENIAAMLGGRSAKSLDACMEKYPSVGLWAMLALQSAAAVKCSGMACQNIKKKSIL